MQSIASCATRLPAGGRQASACKARTVAVNAVRDVFMPALSSTMTEGKITQWLKSEGDKVTKGEPILIVESDKADMEVEAFNDGILAAIVIEDGGQCAVGSTIGYIAESESEVAEAKKKAGGAAAPAPAAPAPAAEAPAPAAAAPAEAAPAPAPVAVAEAPAPAAAPAPAPANVPAPRADGRVIATPYAKRLAKDLKVDLSKIGGTGPNGRITAEDVERAAGKAPAAPAAAAVTAAAPAEAAPIAKKEKAPAVDTKVSELLGTTQPFTGMQAAIARNMEATVDVPVFLVSTSICTDALDSLYKQLKPKGVTMTALICKAAALALAKHPLINACTTADGKGCTYNADVNVAVGVAMPDGGLITPVLKRADVTDVYQLSREWADLVKRARSKQLKPDEYNSGTFTVSNLGMFDVTQFDAVLPKGTGAILAVASSKPTVVANNDGLIGVRKMMTVTLTADHRIIMGADAASFLQTLKETIENPNVMTM